MANTKVEIKVIAHPACEELYIVGSTNSLGAWNLSKAVKLEYCEACGKYTTAKMLPAGEVVEFKILSDKSWDCVEKGLFNEEISNHVIVPEKGLKVEIEVFNFAK